jgi:hypothetical protein
MDTITTREFRRCIENGLADRLGGLMFRLKLTDDERANGLRHLMDRTVNVEAVFRVLIDGHTDLLTAKKDALGRRYGRDLFGEACARRQPELVDAMLSVDPDLANWWSLSLLSQDDDWPRSALILDVLIKHGLDLSAPRNGETMLSSAFYESNRDAIIYLTTKGAKITRADRWWLKQFSLPNAIS